MIGQMSADGEGSQCGEAPDFTVTHELKLRFLPSRSRSAESAFRDG